MKSCFKVSLFKVSAGKVEDCGLPDIWNNESLPLGFITPARLQSDILSWISAALPHLVAPGAGGRFNFWIEIVPAPSDDCEYIVDRLAGDVATGVSCLIAMLPGSSSDHDAIIVSRELSGLAMEGSLFSAQAAFRLDVFLETEFPDTFESVSVSLRMAGILVKNGVKALAVPVDSLAHSFASFAPVCSLVSAAAGYLPPNMLAAIEISAGRTGGRLIRQLHATYNSASAARAKIKAAGIEHDFHALGLITSRPVNSGEEEGFHDTGVAISTDIKELSADPVWYDAQTGRTREFLNQLGRLRKNNICVIVGNGPSLLETDLSVLEQGDVFISNMAAASPLLISKASLIAVTNGLIAEQFHGLLNQLGGMAKIAPVHLAGELHEGAGWHFTGSNPKPEFCHSDPAANISWSSTVTFYLLQLAFHLGYQEVRLIGVDNFYKQPEDAKFGLVLSQDGQDSNHFDPLYFAGMKWQAADVEAMRQVYFLADEAFASAGRKIINLSKGQHAPEFGLFEGRQKAVGAPKAQHPQSIVAGSVQSAPDMRVETAFSVMPVGNQRVNWRLSKAPRRSGAFGSVVPAKDVHSGALAPVQKAKPSAAKKEKCSYRHVEISEILEMDTYSHINVSVFDLKSHERHWNFFAFKLQDFGGTRSIEIRFNDINPVPFISEPSGVESDDWGKFVRLPFFVSDEVSTMSLIRFISSLNGVDRVAYLDALILLSSYLPNVIRNHAGVPANLQKCARQFETAIKRLKAWSLASLIGKIDPKKSAKNPEIIQM